MSSLEFMEKKRISNIQQGISNFQLETAPSQYPMIRHAVLVPASRENIQFPSKTIKAVFK